MEERRVDVHPHRRTERVPKRSVSIETAQARERCSSHEQRVSGSAVMDRNHGFAGRGQQPLKHRLIPTWPVHWAHEDVGEWGGEVGQAQVEASCPPIVWAWVDDHTARQVRRGSGKVWMNHHHRLDAGPNQALNGHAQHRATEKGQQRLWLTEPTARSTGQDHSVDHGTMMGIWNMGLVLQKRWREGDVVCLLSS